MFNFYGWNYHQGQKLLCATEQVYEVYVVTTLLWNIIFSAKNSYLRKRIFSYICDYQTEYTVIVKIKCGTTENKKKVIFSVITAFYLVMKNISNYIGIYLVFSKAVPIF